MQSYAEAPASESPATDPKHIDIGHRPGCETCLGAGKYDDRIPGTDDWVTIPCNYCTRALIDLPHMIASRLLVTANSGGGKSWLVRRLLEQSHGKVQHLIIDPEGEFGSLREKFDYVLVGEDGDVPANPTTAGALARRLLDVQASAIIDLYELLPATRIWFVSEFVMALVDAPKDLWHPCIVVVDEAHNFAPQVGDADSRDAIIGLASKGRKRGFCPVIATQRISKLHKDVAAECNNKLVGRISLDIDAKRAADELGFSGRAGWNSLRKLAPGEFYTFGPAISDEVERVVVGPVATTHPKIGGGHLLAPPAPSEAVRELLSRLGDVPAVAEHDARTLAEAQREIERLRARVAEAVSDEPRDAAYQRDAEAEIDRLNVELSQAQHARRIFMDGLDAAVKRATTAEATLAAVRTALSDAGLPTDDKDCCWMGDPCPDHNPTPAESADVVADFDEIDKIITEAHSDFFSDGEEEGGDDDTFVPVSDAEQRILNAIAWLQGLGVEQPALPAIACLAGYTYNTGAFNGALAALRRAGLVESERGGGWLRLSPDGRRVAEWEAWPRENAALHDAVAERLDAGPAKLLRALVAAYPADVEAVALAVWCGYSPNTGAYNESRAHLRELGLVTYPRRGYIRAAALLFPVPADA